MGWVLAVGMAMGLHLGSARAASPLAPYLDKTSLQTWAKKLRGPFRGQDLEALEIKYQTFVQPQTFRDLLAIYDPANAAKIQVAYPSFTSEGGEKAAMDLGYGLHVVKRLVLNLPDGFQKVIDVNEHWTENRVNHGLYLPDEIRIKTRVLDGERKVPGSERQYFFDSIRLAWSESNEISIQRQTRYTRRDGQINRLKPMRVPVSAPISCMACHDAASTLNERFLGEGETVNREAIVQESFFEKAYFDMHGFQEYVAHLAAEQVSPDFLRRVKRDLNDPAKAFAVPGLFAALEKEIKSYSWLGGDSEITNWAYTSPKRQGAYKKRETWYLDAIEEIFEGKYRWWEPATAVPRPESGPITCARYLCR